MTKEEVKKVHEAVTVYGNMMRCNDKTAQVCLQLLEAMDKIKELEAENLLLKSKLSTGLLDH